MAGWIWFVPTLLVAVAGGYALAKLKVPAGALVGAMLCVGVLNIATGRMFMPPEAKILTKTVAGLFIGMNVTMKTVHNLKKLLKPTAILVLVILIWCLAMGFCLYFVTSLDAVTSLFAVAPGGMTDMTLMSIDMGGDSAVVAVVQMMRLLTVYCVSMPLARWMLKRQGKKAAERADGPKKQPLDPQTKRRRIAFTTLIAVLGGCIGQGLAVLLDFSVLVLVCTMILSAAVNIKTGKLHMPKLVRRFAQILSGALIGTNMTWESWLNLKAALGPALIVCCGFVCINLILALLISRTCKIDPVTAMLSTSAGGATESSLVALDFGADPAVVSVLQISRLVCTTAFYPIIVVCLAPLL